jgi:hypothetical protein
MNGDDQAALCVKRCGFSFQPGVEYNESSEKAEGKPFGLAL